MVQVVAQRVCGLETVALRCFNVFGERQHPTSGYATVIPTFIYLMMPREPLMIYAAGREVRDLTQIDNVLANVAAASPLDVGSSSVCASNWAAVQRHPSPDSAIGMRLTKPSFALDPFWLGRRTSHCCARSGVIADGSASPEAGRGGDARTGSSGQKRTGSP